MDKYVMDPFILDSIHDEIRSLTVEIYELIKLRTIQFQIGEAIAMVKEVKEAINSSGMSIGAKEQWLSDIGMHGGLTIIDNEAHIT